jgi:pSer/pThr/pTyr-binding forkhead associated (FHA) protein
MQLITDISRIVLPLITVILLVKCILALWLGHPKEKIYGYITDMHSGERYPLNMWETSIGRGNSCDIALPYDSIPRVQAVISRRIDGWYIFETLSKAPIKVNGTAVSKKQTVENGDIITMGKIRFRFEIADDPVQRVGKDKKKNQKKSAQAQQGTQKSQQTQRQQTAHRPQQSSQTRQGTAQSAQTQRRSNAASYTVETPKVQKNVRRVTQHCIVNKDTGEIFILCGNEVRIGTARRSDIKLTSKNAGKTQALIVLYEDGWAVEDCGSGRPTLLNGKKVTAPQLLFDGDIIAVGDERLYYKVKTKTVS